MDYYVLYCQSLVNFDMLCNLIVLDSELAKTMAKEYLKNKNSSDFDLDKWKSEMRQTNIEVVGD